MLALARLAIEEAILHGRIVNNLPSEGAFAGRRGVFVTLHVAGKLRGCIGVVEGLEPLGEGIARCAASAALEDPRFPSLKKEELQDLSIEISLLSPLAPIRPEEIAIGRHGLYIAQGSHRGLLLPQVATEHHLDREQFLAETSRKAGLPREAWREPETVISGFTCEILSDQDRPPGS